MDAEASLPGSKESLWCWVRATIESGSRVCSFLTTPRCLRRRPLPWRRCAGPASPKGQRPSCLSHLKEYLAAKSNVCKHRLFNLSLINILGSIYTNCFDVYRGIGAPTQVRGYFASPEFGKGPLFGTFWSDLSIWSPRPAT